MELFIIITLRLGGLFIRHLPAIQITGRLAESSMTVVGLALSGERGKQSKNECQLFLIPLLIDFCRIGARLESVWAGNRLEGSNSSSLRHYSVRMKEAWILHSTPFRMRTLKGTWSCRIRQCQFGFGLLPNQSCRQTKAVLPECKDMLNPGFYGCPCYNARPCTLTERFK